MTLLTTPCYRCHIFIVFYIFIVNEMKHRSFLGHLGCGQVDDILTVNFSSPNMTIQFCVEVCRGLKLNIAAVIVRTLERATWVNMIC